MEPILSNSSGSGYGSSANSIVLDSSYSNKHATILYGEHNWAYRNHSYDKPCSHDASHLPYSCSADQAEQSLPCNTLLVGNLPLDASEDELWFLFKKQTGFKKLCFRTKQNDHSCLVEFENTRFAANALGKLHGHRLRNNVYEGIRLSYTKSTLDPDTKQRQHAFDTTGQVAPPGMEPRVTMSWWEDEASYYFQVVTKEVRVARRVDIGMINGTKLLDVAGMTPGHQHKILSNEKMIHVTKKGPEHLKGVWIPIERALYFANIQEITESLYPLFVHDIGALIYHPANLRIDINATDTPRYYLGAPAALEPPVHDDQSFRPQLGSQQPVPDPALAFPAPSTNASSIVRTVHNGDSHDIDEKKVYDSVRISTRSRSASSASSPTSTLPISQSHDVIMIHKGIQEISKPSKMSPRGSHQSRFKNEDSTSENKSDLIGNLDDSGCEPTTTIRDEGVKSRKLPQSRRRDDVLQKRFSSEPFTLLSRGSTPPETTVFVKEESDIQERSAPEEVLVAAQSPDSQISREELSLHHSSDVDSPCNTDSTGEEPFSQMDIKKRGIIIRLMKEFYSIFGLTSGAVTCAGSTSSGPPQGTVSSSSSSAQSSGGRGSKRKATDADLPPGDNNGRDDSNKRPKRGSEKHDAGLSTANKFACPYFKRNPRKYQRVRSCPGPGWDTLHRLKLVVRICTKVSRD